MITADSTSKGEFPHTSVLGTLAGYSEGVPSSNGPGATQNKEVLREAEVARTSRGLVVGGGGGDTKAVCD